MNKSKFWTILISVVVVIIAISVGVGGSVLINKNKALFEKASNKVSLKTIKTEKTEKVTKQMSPEITSYMRTTQVKIKNNWKPSSDKSGRVILSYKINKDGTLKEYKIISSSGVKELEEEAINALKKSIPFEPLPKAFDGDNVDVQFTFDYNVEKK